MSLPTPMAAVLPPQVDPHRESRERAERLLAAVDRELRENPSDAAHAARTTSSISFHPGLRA